MRKLSHLTSFGIGFFPKYFSIESDKLSCKRGKVKVSNLWMAGTLKFSLSELGLRGENETAFRIKSYKELGTYPPKGLHGHLQPSEDGQTLVWTLVCYCAVVGIALGCSWHRLTGSGMV